MGFDDALGDLIEKSRDYAGSLVTEEATKNAIVMPFISRVLGYDVFNPSEVVPEFVCDVGTKKGEKIDYAITRDGQVQMLIEVKKIGESLALQHASQLVRYFHVSNARVAVLTNGQYWHFFTDLDRPNVMDERPFLKLDLLNVDPYALPELKKLTKDAFDLDSVIAAAEELKYVSAVKTEIGEQFKAPDDEFVRLLARRVYSRSLTVKMLDFFRGVTEKALKQYINDRVNERLKSALQGQGPTVPVAPAVDAAQPPTEAVSPAAPGSSSRSMPDAERHIETTEEEMEAFRIVRAIVASEVPYNRVFSRDTQSYFGVLLDDNNRKPIARLHFNRRAKYIGLVDANKDETRIPVEVPEDIYRQADALRAVVRRYLTHEDASAASDSPALQRGSQSSEQARLGENQ